MTGITSDFRVAATISLLIVLPFMMLEWVTRSDLPRSNFPIPLFIIMWLVAVLFFLVLMPIVRDARTANSTLANPASLLLRISLLILIAWAWIGVIVDQMPCFLGGSGC